MFRCAVAVLVLIVSAVFVAPAQTKTKVTPQHVFVIEGTAPAKVKKKDLVRIVQSALPGSEITAKISGPGKIAGAAYVRRIKDGEEVPGATIKEYTIKPQKKGTIKVTVTVKPPAGKGGEEHVYTIEVE